MCHHYADDDFQKREMRCDQRMIPGTGFEFDILIFTNRYYIKLFYYYTMECIVLLKFNMINLFKTNLIWSPSIY